jgi:hypothetical protein
MAVELQRSSVATVRSWSTGGWRGVRWRPQIEENLSAADLTVKGG